MMEEPTGEWQEWFRLTPLERWRESTRPWEQHIAQGGTLETGLRGSGHLSGWPT
jgi:hypothetical protein